MRPHIIVWKPRRDGADLLWSAQAGQTLDSFADYVVVEVDLQRPQDECQGLLDKALATADGLVICSWGSPGIGYLSAQRLAQAPRLRYIGSTCHYRQAQFVDMACALARGISFSETAPLMSPWVAEYELTLGLAALRRLPQEHAIVGVGGWVRPEDDLMHHLDWPDRLEGRHVGLASFGEIHRHLARLLAPFATDWEAYDPYISAERIAAVGGRKVDDLVAMASRSEVFFIATPPTPQTLGIINHDVIYALPRGAVVVLVSRMVVVDQAPLLARLQAGELRAAIDVYEPEPPPQDSPLRHLSNVIHTPHRAGNNVHAHRSVFLGQCEEACRYFAGQPLQYPLRPELVALYERA